MKPETGFSNDGLGITKYIDICKKNGLLPVGCGTNSYNCDKMRWNGEPCLPMPNSWSCHMMDALKSNTGWGKDFVAIHAQAGTGFLDMPNGTPNGNDYLKAVCGKVAGILHH